MLLSSFFFETWFHGVYFIYVLHLWPNSPHEISTIYSPYSFTHHLHSFIIINRCINSSLAFIFVKPKFRSLMILYYFSFQILHHWNNKLELCLNSLKFNGSEEKGEICEKHLCSTSFLLIYVYEKIVRCLAQMFAAFRELNHVSTLHVVSNFEISLANTSMYMFLWPINV